MVYANEDEKGGFGFKKKSAPIGALFFLKLEQGKIKVQLLNHIQ
jgi:hypothetical protein